MKRTIDPRQDELLLSSVMSHAVFPGRDFLRIKEVAGKWRTTDQHIIGLIDKGKIIAIDMSTGRRSDELPKGNKTARRHWRIPVSEYDRFIAENNSLAKPT